MLTRVFGYMLSLGGEGLNLQCASHVSCAGLAVLVFLRHNAVASYHPDFEEEESLPVRAGVF